MSFAVSQYRTSKIETASPLGLVVALYDGAIRRIAEARAAFGRGDKTAARGALMSAHAIVSELCATLQVSAAPELCAQLERLYEYVLHTITTAHVGNDSAQLASAESVLRTLRSGWVELMGRAP